MQPPAHVYKAYQGSVLPDTLTDLTTVIVRLKKTINEWVKWQGKVQKFKRKFSFKYWNRAWHLSQVRQLLLIATMVDDADGAFVSMAELLAAARTISVGRNVRANYSNGEGSSDFRQWVMHNLSPAVQDFKHHHGNQTVGVFFYKCVNSAQSAERMKASYEAICDELDGRSVRNKVGQLDLQGYIQLLPSNALKHVVVALMSQLETPTHLLARGIGIARQRRAKERVDLALLMTAEFERKALEAFGVPSNLTVEGGASKMRCDVRQQQLEALADEYAGGRTTLLDTAEDVGLDLGKEIEDSAKQLSSLNYGMDNGGRGLCVNDKRDSTAQLRSCSYESIAEAVQKKIRTAAAKLNTVAAAAAKSIKIRRPAVTGYVHPDSHSHPNQLAIEPINQPTNQPSTHQPSNSFTHPPTSHVPHQPTSQPAN